MSVWFVSPAWRRPELSAVCYEQLATVMGILIAQGVKARCVVVADDENLDIASALNFDTVRQRNSRGLGRKFNDGFQYAAANGAEWIVPYGSDSFVDPQYFLPLPSPAVTRTAGLYAVVEAGRMAELNVTDRKGAGPRMFHRSLLEPSGFRPADDKLMRTIDASTARGIVNSTGKAIAYEWRDIHPLQYIGFRYAPFITGYGSMWRTWGVTERTDHWERLCHIYPPHLVERVRRLMT